MNIGATALICTIGLGVACGGKSPSVPSSTPASTAERPTVALTTTHFRVFAGLADATVVRAVGDALEANYPRLTADLRTGDLSLTDVWLWQDSQSFYSDMQQTIGQLYQGSTGYVRNAHAVSVLVGSNTPLTAVHEFSHVVSLAVNPTFGNNPRWLWETVALYENHQFVNPASLEYLRAGRFPSLADLNSDFNLGRQVYDVGCMLGEFIVSTWGMDSLVALIRANGRIEQVLSVSAAVFEQRWQAWCRDRYLSQ